MGSTSWQWEEDGYTVTRSACWSAPGTHGGCGLLLYSKNGRLMKVLGDPDAPFNGGRACAKTLGVRRFMEHPQRLLYPLRRKGARGENRWERISWDQAVEIVAEKFEAAKNRFGPESVCFMQGTGRDTIGLKRLSAAFGSPNFLTLGPASGLACFWPRIANNLVSTGEFMAVPDMSQHHPGRYASPEWKLPQCILVWGYNPAVNCADGFFGHWIIDCMKRGSQVVVVDPRRTWLASRADTWLQVRPGTDAALALSMLHVIFSEGLQNQPFLNDWTYGQELLRKQAASFPPATAAEITGVPAARIAEAARRYANARPACIQWGIGLDMTRECMGGVRAVANLMAVTGNIDVPGGNIFGKSPLPHGFWGEELLPKEATLKKIGVDRYPLWSMLPIAHPDVWLDRMEKDPAPCKAAWIQGTNTFVGSFADPKRVCTLFKKLEFVAVVELFNTPTVSALADVVLPAAMFPERDGLQSVLLTDRIQAMNRAVSPPGECLPDLEILRRVGRRLSPEAWPYENTEEIFDELLEPVGMTFRGLREQGPIYSKFEYRKHEKGLLRPDGQPGFNTPTGKIELYSTVLESFGADPMPGYEEPDPGPRSTPELVKEYPLTLSTGGRTPFFFNSEHRQVGGGMRELNPDPLLDIHPETAETLGIREGDWVCVENPWGRCRLKARLTTTVPRDLVHAQHSWWFPEKEMAEPCLGGAFESNINMLLPLGLQGKSGFGYPFKVNICKVTREDR